MITGKSTENYIKREAGGKGYNLYLLSREGFLVPKWAVLEARLFKKFRTVTGLGKKIQEILANLQGSYQGLSSSELSKKLRLAESAIHDLIMKTPLPAEMNDEALQAYAYLSAPLIAVRSSALDEDSVKHSFAGQLSSFLFVRTEEEALNSIKECWASAYSERGLSYRIQNKIDLNCEINVAVVLQEMVDSEKSGVVFTCDPIAGDSSKITINSVYGIGEGLVSGLLEADTFSIEKKTGKLLSQEIAVKKTQLIQDVRLGGTQEVKVGESFQNQASLSEKDLQELTEISRKVEAFYRFPQDIEWGWSAGKFYLLQSRPVTTPVKNDQGHLWVWDNSNIVESYGGMTAPLTFTFARHVYHSVYVQFCEILMIPSSEIRKMDYFLRNMLGIFNGRIFYNLLNWYKLTSILPGFKYNRKFMETMMGTDHSLADEIADRIKPPGSQERLVSKFRRLISGLKFLYFHFTIQTMVDRFLKYFHEVYDSYRKRDYSRLPADEIYEIYKDLEARMLFEWKAPIVNDYLCMVHFGILKALTGKWLASLGPAIQNDLLCGEGNLESAEPTRELIRMAAELKRNPGLAELILTTPAEDCMEQLTRSVYDPFKARVHRYIDLYGFRCMNEMKLEEKDLFQESSFLFVILKNYLKSGQTDLEAYEKREKEIRSAAEKKVFENLSGLKRVIYLWSLRNARKAVRNRENTRFCRTRVYGIARAMFYGIGRDFTARNLIDCPEDLFFLHLEEVSGALEATLPVYALRSLIELRKSEYARVRDLEPSSRFMTRGPVYWMNDYFLPEEETTGDAIAQDLPPNALKGVGCCPGIVEGVVKVILSPQDDMELNKEILVTLRTDPGWIPLYPSASALLVERGGLLSHSAIVAREMGLPTVVGVKGLTEKLKSGMRVRINGETGLIEILDEEVSVGLKTKIEPSASVEEALETSGSVG